MRIAPGSVAACAVAGMIACGGVVETAPDAATSADGAADASTPTSDSAAPFDVAVVDSSSPEGATEAGNGDASTGGDAMDSSTVGDAGDAANAGDAADAGGCPPTYGGSMAGCPVVGLTCDYPQGTCVCTQGCCGIPKTCAQQGIQCGKASDGCGGILDCGMCQAPQVCGGGGQPGICGLSDGGCVPMTCADQPWACGIAGDGCGGVLDCSGNCAWACTPRAASCPGQAPGAGAACSTPGQTCAYPDSTQGGCCTTAYQCTAGDTWSAGTPMCPG